MRRGWFARRRKNLVEQQDASTGEVAAPKRPEDSVPDDGIAAAERAGHHFDEPSNGSAAPQ